MHHLKHDILHILTISTIISSLAAMLSSSHISCRGAFLLTGFTGQILN
jgi:hypothetical protein